MSRLTQGCARVLPVRGCHPLWPAFPDGSGCHARITGLVRVRSPLLTESRLMSFPQATEMFQFAWFASRTYVFSSGSPCGGVSPFGNPRIKACSRLPMAYRSVPRPSSPLGAKASTKCPYLTLDLRSPRPSRALRIAPKLAQKAWNSIQDALHTQTERRHPTGSKTAASRAFVL